MLPNGKVLVAGGNGTSGSLTSAQLYDPATNSWSAGVALNPGRALHSATLLPNGKMLVAGGEGSGGNLTSAALYDSASTSWSAAAALTTTRNGPTATLLPNGKVLVAAGSNASILANAELYDPATDSWSAAAALTTARNGPTVTLLPNGKVLVAGGHGNSGFLASAELYDPATNSWSAAAALTTARYQHTATLLPNGKVLVASGRNSAGFFASAELYDPATNSWSAAGSLATERYLHTATLLPNGKVLVAGGTNGSALTSAELYDPATDSWSAAGSLTTGRFGHTATLLPNGKVLLAAGMAQNGGWLASADLYDPATNSWSVPGALTTARNAHTATLLSNGKVLVAGGNGSSITYLTNAELYDPATNSWSAAAALATGRLGHAATLLPNGKVLVAGGYASAYLASAELFDAGLVPDATRQPLLSSVTAALLPNIALVASGTGFRPNLEGSGGTGNSSATNFPLIQIMRLDNGQTRWLAGDSATPFSDTTVTASVTALSGFPYGHVRVTAFVNGIPSAAQLMMYGPIAPDAPVIGTATAGDAQATVTFTAPASDGGSAITGYTVTSDPAGGIDSNAGSTSLSHVITGLTNGQAYTFTVTATNVAGTGAASAASNSVSPIAVYTLTYTVGANGTIDGTSLQTVNHGSNGSAVTAVPAANHHFVNWSDASTANPRTDSNVTGNITVTANFAIDTFTLTYTAAANGSITGSSPQTVNHGSSGSAVTAVPATGYHFVNWSDASTANPRTDSNVTGDKTVTANFAINTYTLSYTAGANGSITGTSPQMVNHGSSGSAVTAVPAANHYFVNWSDASTANPRTDSNVTGNVAVTANFAINTYTLSYTAGANGSITGTSPQTVNHGSSSSAVTAVPATGYRFVNWSDASTANPRTDSNVTGYVAVNANFAINPFSVSYNANTATGGSVPVDGLTYATGATVTVLGNTGSLIKPGFTFAGWNTAANGSGTARPAASSFAMGDANVVLYAQFANVPGAPVIGTAVPGGGRATVSFAAPASNGGSAITSYAVTCSATGQTTRSASGTGSPITVSGLTAGIAYACSAVASNGAGSGASSNTTPVTPLTGVDIVPILLLLLLD